MMLRTQIATALAALALVAATFKPVRDFVSGYGAAPASALAQYDGKTLTPEQRGAVAFTLGNFGGLDTHALETHAVPWRLAGAALVLDEAARSGAPVNADTLRSVMRGFGFLYPASLGNWPAGIEAPAYDGPLATPLGVTVGVMERSVPALSVTVANLGCASCHAGPARDANGEATNVAWLGAPNTSLDLEAYVQALYAAFLHQADRPGALLAAVKQVFPDTSELELRSLRDFVLPRVRQRLAKIGYAGQAGPLPFVNGAPGITNGVAALKMQLRLLPADAMETQRGFTAIPDLADRALRTSLLSDGAYSPADVMRDEPRLRSAVTTAHEDALADVTAFFTVPSMGVKPDVARDHLASARDVFRFLATYAPPCYPGAVDAARAREGRALYGERCAECHGAYDDAPDHPRLAYFPNRIAPSDTDPERAAVFTPDLAAAVNGSRYGHAIRARTTGGYVAPPLTGVWMSAPYLHNGSVPTLRQLFYPAERAQRFMLGGHRLDLEEVGVAGVADSSGVRVYPKDVRAFSTPQVIDTTARGFSNRGHEKEFEDLSDAEKDALIEYLKLL